MTSKVLASLTENQYCTAFDMSYAKNKKFAGLLVKHCLTRVAVKKSIIIPPTSVINKIEKMNREDATEALKVYILYWPYSMDKLVEKGGKNIRSLAFKQVFPVTVKGSDVLLNGVKLTPLGKTEKSGTLYKVTKALKTVPYVPPETEDTGEVSGETSGVGKLPDGSVPRSGAGKKKRRKKRSGGCGEYISTSGGAKKADQSDVWKFFL